MAGQIGRVFSPQVMEALIRRGENRYAGGGTRRVRERQYAPTEDAEALKRETRREDRLDREQELEESRAKRSEAFARDEFEHRKTQDQLGWQREERMAAEGKERLKQSGDRVGLVKAGQEIAQMRDANQLIATIGKLQAARNRTDPNTFEVPKGQAEAIDGLVQIAMNQLAQVVGPERAAAMMQQMGGSPFGSTPARRAPGLSGPGMDPGFSKGPGSMLNIGEGGMNPFSALDEEAEDELDDLIPGIPR